MPKPSKRSDSCPELESFGEAVRMFRQQLGMSQEALAHLAGIDRSYMGGIERGEHNVALVNIKKIASALGVTVYELMREADL